METTDRIGGSLMMSDLNEGGTMQITPNAVVIKEQNEVTPLSSTYKNFKEQHNTFKFQRHVSASLMPSSVVCFHV